MPKIKTGFQHKPVNDDTHVKSDSSSGDSLSPPRKRTNPYSVKKAEPLPAGSKTISITPSPSWTRVDRARLYDYVVANKPGDWDRAAQHVPGKTAKQCRDQWMKTLGPYIKKTCDLDLDKCDRSRHGPSIHIR